MYFCIIGINVFFFLLSTGTMKIFDLSFFSLPLKTHLPSTCHPLLYFLFSNFDSLISTSTPRPSVGSLMCRTVKIKVVFITYFLYMYSVHVFVMCIPCIMLMCIFLLCIPYKRIKDMFNFYIAG